MKEFAGIGLGANLARPDAQVQAAFAALAALPETKLLACSRLYQSKPVGPANQADYCNAAALIKTSLSALDLLKHLQAIEAKAGRVRHNSPRWGARVLDLDLLFYGQMQCNTPELCLPHPELTRRNFVLTPLAEIAGDIEIIKLGLVAKLAENLSQDGLCLWPDNLVN